MPGLFASKTTYANIILRMSSLGLRFVLLYFIARDLTLDQLGVWGIITTSIALCLYLVGLDFYTYSSREILQYPERERLPYLRDQMLFYLLNYIVIFPALGFLFLTDVISTQYLFIFYGLLLIEHLAQESYRTLILFSRPLQANIVLFIRSGAWITILLIGWISGIEQVKTLPVIFYSWMAGGVISLLLSAYYFAQMQFLPLHKTKVNWNWIKKGLRISGFFFIGTAGYKIIDFSDRYFIQHFKGTDAAGIYIFYGNISNIVETLVYTLSVIMLTPRLLSFFGKNDEQYTGTFRLFTRQIFLFTTITAIAAVAVTWIALFWLGKPEIRQEFFSFILLILARSILNFSLIFHYALYVRKHDRPLITSSLIAALINTGLNFLLIPAGGITGAALATGISLLIMLLLKFRASRRFPEIETIFGKMQKSK